jgi:hypothetical protein
MSVDKCRVSEIIDMKWKQLGDQAHFSVAYNQEIPSIKVKVDRTLDIEVEAHPFLAFSCDKGSCKFKSKNGKQYLVQHDSADFSCLAPLSFCPYKHYE